MVRAACFALLAQNSLSVLASPAAGTAVANAVTVNYQIAGVSQSPVIGSTGFTVDAKTNFTVSSAYTSSAKVMPGAVAQVLTFTVVNTGNTTADFSLSATALQGGSAKYGGNDNFDATDIVVRVESGATPGYQAGEDTTTYIDELAPGASETVYLVADIPMAQSTGDIASYHLVAQVQAGGGAGSLGAALTQTTAADTVGSVDLVFADAQGSDTANDALHDAKFSAQNDYEVTMSRTTASLSLLYYDATGSSPALTVKLTEYDTGGGNFATIPVPAVPGDNNALVTDAPLALKPATSFNHGQPLFIRVQDTDQNRDPLSIDTVTLSLSVQGGVEAEVLRLRETAVDNGEFVGYITLNDAAAAGNDGVLDVEANGKVTVSYTDSVDGSDSAVSVALVDPYGRVFDSETGALLDGFTVRLVDATTGALASVYGDDGVSMFPAAIVSGGTAADSAGNVYDFTTGCYRFPFVAPGVYQLVVTPPAGAAYRSPSTKSDAQLASVPSGPFNVGTGSRAEAFSVVAGPPLLLDIPIDPLPSALYVQRNAGRDRAAAGDFLPFEVDVENVSQTDAVAGVTLTDTLPHGFRYRKGSAKLNGVAIDDPAIGDDGLTLNFALADLAAGTLAKVSYVTAVGAVRTDKVQSQSQASGNAGAITSNIATVSTLLSEEFFAGHNVLMGQVLIDDNAPGEFSGLPGARVFMEDGTYTVTDVQGRFHFEGVTPGMHVVQLDLDTLPGQYEVISHNDNTRSAGQPWSKFVDLQGGTLWQVDFHVALKPELMGKVRLTVSGEQRADNMLRYTLAMNAQTIPVRNQRLTVQLPNGTHYVNGSSSLDGRALPDPGVDGDVLEYALPNTVKPDWNRVLQLGVALGLDRSQHHLSSVAKLSFETPDKNARTTLAVEHKMAVGYEAADHIDEKFSAHFNYDKLDLERDLTSNERTRLDELAQTLSQMKAVNVDVVGYSDDGPVPNSKLETADANRLLSTKQAQRIARYVKNKLNLPPSLIHYVGNGADEPIADNATPGGRAANCRVEVNVFAKRREYIAKVEPATAVQETATKGRLPNKAWLTASDAAKPEQIEPNYDANWLASATSGIEWLSPAADAVPAVGGIDVVIKHAALQTVTLTLNGALLSKDAFAGVMQNETGVALSRWHGVVLMPGNNHLVAAIHDGDAEVERIERDIYLGGTPSSVEVVADRSMLVADGINAPVIALKLFDRSGRPVPAGVRGELRVMPPYLPARDNTFNTASMAGAGVEKSDYVVGADGLAHIRLQPTVRTGAVELQLPLADGPVAHVTADLKPRNRDWILVGLAEGTLGYNTINGHTEALQDNAPDENLFQDGRVAFFAKGRVSGKWLLTLAYDSSKKASAQPNLYGTIDPGTYYTIYSDISGQAYAAPSSKHLYVRLERDKFYALFGDFNTGLRQTELTPYTRNLTGLSTQYHDERYDVVAFASESRQAFVRDELRGEGVAGPYALSRDTIVMNSDQVVIEVRDRFQSEVIISRSELTRHVDYDIDYEKGTIVFRQPVFSTDYALNPTFIVVKYESFAQQDTTLSYGGRVAARVNRDLTVGVTHVEEGRVGGDASISGVDVQYRLKAQTVARVEVARSNNSDLDNNDKGEAYLAEIDHRGKAWDGRAYVRKQGEAFGLGQTNGSETGTQKVGVEGRYRPMERVIVTGRAYRQDNTATGAARNLIETQGQYHYAFGELRVGARSVIDSLGNDTEQSSYQLTAGASRRFLGDRLNLRVDREQSVDDAASVDFPTRTLIGADYVLNQSTKMFAEQEWANGNVRDTSNTRVGLKVSPWTGGEIASTVKQQKIGDGAKTSASINLSQRWKLSDAWSLDFGAEQSKLLGSQAGTPFNTNVPYASGPGNGDFTAASLGATYSPGAWLWTARIEARDGATDDSWRAATSVQTRPGAGLDLLTSMSAYSSVSTTGAIQRNANAGLGLAYRPAVSPWRLLDKLELIGDQQAGGTFNMHNWRIVNNFNGNYRIGRGQIAMQYGAKYLTETIDGTDFAGYLDLVGVESRYDLNAKWDVGVQGSVLHSWTVAQYDYSAGVSVGHSFAKNIWLSLGYNLVGFHDDDFSRYGYTDQGPFLKFRMKFDQYSIRELHNFAKASAMPNDLLQ